MPNGPAQVPPIDWKTMLPRLAVYARIRLRRLGWAEGRDEEPSAMSAKKLVNMAIERFFDDRRAWNPDAVDFETFMRGVIRSIASSELKKVLRQQEAQAAEAAEPEQQASPEALLGREEEDRELVALVDRCVADDEELQLLWLAIQDGVIKRDAIAETLGWTPARVTTARIRFNRRLARAAPTRFASAIEGHRRTP